MRPANLPGGMIRRLSFAGPALMVCAAAFASACHSQDTAGAAAPRGAFEISFTPGSRDDAGRLLGGTEMRVLAAHAGRLYAGNGYWEDQPGPEGLQGAEILVLDRAGGQWRADHVFEERMPDGRARNLAVSLLGEVNFATDGDGQHLAAPVSMLIAATWDLTGEARIFTRDDSTGAWTAATLVRERWARGDRDLPQVRSFGVHRDRVTGVDYVFAGQDPRGVFRGVYDPAVPGRIRWSDAPELDISTISLAAFPQLAGRLRISSFAECDGRLYAAVGQQIYERVDGAEPHWRLIYANARPGRSETGLRGLTAVADPAGGGHALIAAVEGSAARIVRVDPRDGGEATDLDLREFLGKAWGMRVGYIIAAYNDMAMVHDAGGRDALAIGIEAFIAPNSLVAEGHSVVDVGYGRLESGAWYLIRRPTGRYDLRRIAPLPGHPTPMVATRSILASPFPQDGDALYFAGYDANKATAHNTAWIVRSTVAAAIGGS
jgi:poly(A) polymerase